MKEDKSKITYFRALYLKTMGLKINHLKSNITSQIKVLLPIISITNLPLICLFIIIRLQTIVPIGNLTRDPVAILNQPFYTGILSQIGVLFWCSCASICLFCARLTKKTKQRKLSLFLFASGALTTVLLIDDLFLIHELIFPSLVNRAFSPLFMHKLDWLTILNKLAEKAFLFFEALFFALYLLKFVKIIQNTEFLPLLIACVFFGLSGFLDIGLVPTPQVLLENEGQYLLEDGAKLLGIINWLTYFTRVCMTEITGIASASRY